MSAVLPELFTFIVLWYVDLCLQHLKSTTASVALRGRLWAWHSIRRGTGDM